MTDINIYPIPQALAAVNLPSELKWTRLSYSTLKLPPDTYLPHLIQRIQKEFSETKYASLTLDEKANFIANVEFINSKVDSHNRKIYTSPYYLLHLFLQAVTLGRYGLTWVKIALDTDAKINDIFHPWAPRRDGLTCDADKCDALMAALPLLAQIKVIPKESSVLKPSFLQQYGLYSNLRDATKFALMESKNSYENKGYYYDLFASGEPIFDFTQYDSELFCQILQDLASGEFHLGSDVAHYGVLLKNLAKLVEENGNPPIANLFCIAEFLKVSLGKKDVADIFETWRLEASLMDIMKAVASHPETQTNLYFLQALSKAAVYDMRIKLTGGKAGYRGTGAAFLNDYEEITNKLGVSLLDPLPDDVIKGCCLQPAN